MKNIPTTVIEDAARMLRVIAHPARIRIIQLLDNKKRLPVGEIQKVLHLRQSMTSQHLSALKRIGVVACDKDGNICRYRIANPNVLKLLDCVNRSAAARSR